MIAVLHILVLHIGSVARFGVIRQQFCRLRCYKIAVLYILVLHIGSVAHFVFTLSAVLHGCLAGGGGGGVCGRHDHHSGQGAGSGRQRRWTFVILCCGQPAAILIY